MTAALHSDPKGPAGMSLSTVTVPVSGVCAVRLVDRRTGRTHRVNGSPLVLFTKTPDLAVAELLSGRDTAVWEARVEPINPDIRKGGARE